MPLAPTPPHGVPAPACTPWARLAGRQFRPEPHDTFSQNSAACPFGGSCAPRARRRRVPTRLVCPHRAGMTTGSAQLKQAMMLLLKVVSDPEAASTAIRLGKGAALCTRLNFINGPRSLLNLLRLPTGPPGDVTPETLRDAAHCALQRLAQHHRQVLVICAHAEVAQQLLPYVRHAPEVLRLLVVLTQHPKAAASVLSSDVLPQVLRMAMLDSQVGRDAVALLRRLLPIQTAVQQLFIANERREELPTIPAGPGVKELEREWVHQLKDAPRCTCGQPGFPAGRGGVPLCARKFSGGGWQRCCAQKVQAFNKFHNPANNARRAGRKGSRASDTAVSAKLLNTVMGGGLLGLLENVRQGVEQGARLVSSRPSGAGVYVGNGKVSSVFSHKDPEWCNRVFHSSGSVLRWPDAAGARGRISAGDAVTKLGAYFIPFGQTTSGLECAMVSSHPAGSHRPNSLLSCAPCVRADREGCAAAHEGARAEELHRRAGATALV